MKNVVLFLVMASVLGLAEQKPRVFVHGSHGYVYVWGVDHALPRLDGSGHDQTMELAKTFLQRCPNVIPTVNKENADFDVQLNWTPKTRLFFGGKLIHKPDQILVTNRNGDVLYSGIARSVGGDVEGACRAIQQVEPGALAQARQTGASFAANDTYHVLPSSLSSSATSPVKYASETSTAKPSASLISAALREPSNDLTSSRSNVTLTIPALGLTVTTRSEGGVEVLGVASGSVADAAYLHVGDVINAFDGKPVNNAVELAALCGTTARGAKVRVGYLYHTAAVGYVPKEAVIIAQ
jgi:PDZ domain